MVGEDECENETGPKHFQKFSTFRYYFNAYQKNDEITG